MSTPLGIAAVTAVLRGILNNGLIDAGLTDIVGSDITVSSTPPDRISLAGTADPNQLNIFLYQTSLNASWRNEGNPERGSGGQRIANSPLAVNLHYMLSAYGAADYYPEVILGHAMQILHENSVLTRGAIKRALSPPVPVPGLPKQLADALLAEQVEMLKITPEVLNNEELSRLWSAIQARYRPSVAYQVTVVLIEGTRSISAALPVAASSGQSLPFPQVAIAGVEPDTGPGTPFLPTGKLVIRGQSLRADDVRIRIGDTELPAGPDVTPSTIVFPLPAVLPAGFFAGVKGVQVVQSVMLGVPPTGHSIYTSNVEAIILRPAITAALKGVPTSSVVDAVTYKTGAMHVAFTPDVGRAQRVTLLLNEYNPPAARAPHAYSFPAPAANGIVNPAVTQISTIDIPFKLVLPGTYLVRVQVDGAESVLTLAAGIYTNPQVAI